MLGIVLALGSSVAWGTSDFLGGLRARRMSALTVLLVSQPVGLVLAVIVALIVGGDSLSTRDTFIAAGAGATVVMALGAFYKAMALGSVTVVATIGALGVLVPVIGGLVQGDHPGPIQAVGAVAGIVGVAWSHATRVARGRAPLDRPCSACRPRVRTFFLGLNLSSAQARVDDRGRAHGRVHATLPRRAAIVRPSMHVEREPSSAFPRWRSGCSTASPANSSFAVATNHSLLSLVAVAGSLYSAVTVLLARFVLGERLAAPQRAGGRRAHRRSADRRGRLARRLSTLRLSTGSPRAASLPLDCQDRVLFPEANAWRVATRPGSVSDLFDPQPCGSMGLANELLFDRDPSLRALAVLHSRNPVQLVGKCMVGPRERVAVGGHRSTGRSC